MNDTLSINSLRVIGAEIIGKAKSGHPGIVLGAAPMAHTLFTRHLNINPANPKWYNRDRFVLSAGHGSMLLYMLLHLAGFKVSMDDLKNFRQKGSLTPGHPEFGHTDGVEVSTGPLGQGLSTSVGLALAESFLAKKFNKDGYKIIDNYTYVLCGDGDLEEGTVRPRITKVLMMLEPRILVMAKSVLPCATETILTTNSGIEVPNATTVKPMTKSLIPKRLAIAEAPSTRKSAPLTSATKPTITNTIATHMPYESKLSIIYN